VNEVELTPVPVPSVVQGTSSATFGVSPGSAAPDFEIALLGKEGMLRLSDFKGKVVVLNFWASWCPPCRWEMPDFERMWQEYRDKDVVFLGVAVADFEDKALGFAEKTGVTYPLALDATGEVAKDYGITSMPTTYFIDREGKVARRLVSVANKGVLRVFLEGQLKQ
jgi:peroxiredoxin